MKENELIEKFSKELDLVLLQNGYSNVEDFLQKLQELSEDSDYDEEVDYDYDCSNQNEQLDIYKDNIPSFKTRSLLRTIINDYCPFNYNEDDDFSGEREFRCVEYIETLKKLNLSFLVDFCERITDDELNLLLTFFENMGYVNEDPITDIEKEIITILGDNETDCRVIYLYNNKFGVYSFKGRINVIYNYSDIDFSKLKDNIQADILKELVSGNYTIDSSFQG